MPKRCPECGKTLPAGIPAWVRGLKVADVMTAAPVTLGPEDTLMHAVEVMRLHSIRRIPIVVGDSLIGLLAEGDLKRAQPSILDATQEEFNRVMDGTQVARIMISNPITVQEDTPLFEAAQKEAPGFAFVVRSMQIEFLKPARMDDILEVTTAPSEVKGASITLAQRLTRAGEVLIEARVRVAFVSGGRARPIPQALRAVMRADRAAGETAA